MLTQIASLVLGIPNGFRVRAVAREDTVLTLHVAPKRRRARCPLCSHQSERVHSHYERTLADVPMGNNGLVLRWQVRRFFCDHPSCSRRIFAERLPQMAPPRQRRTTRLAAWGQQIACALGGNAGARLCQELHIPLSASTLLRHLHRTPVPAAGTLKAIGIDDWAFKKGRTYGTIVVDLHTGKTVDLLPDREKATVTAWLKAHPEVEVVSRDRSASYAEAVREGAPQAQQVADRWHLLHNLAEVLERLLLHHRSCLLDQEPTPAQEAVETLAPAAVPPKLPPEPSLSSPRPLSGEERERQARLEGKQERFAQVQALASQGLSQRAIARQMGLHRVTVRTWLGSDAPPQRPSTSTIGPKHHAFVRQCWEEGRRDLKAIHAQLMQKGFRVSYSALYRAVRHLRRPSTPAPPPARRISPRSAACRLLVRPEKRDAKDERLRNKLVSASETLAKALDLADRFATMLRQRQHEALDAWLHDCQQSGIGEFVRFARSLLQDKAAVEAAFTLEWSNGVTEGNVNRLKTIKRQMYGRASFTLLKARVLHYP